MKHTYNRSVYLWLWSGIILITIMVVVGGITRLTGSGLSMTDWNLIMGAIPPMNDVEWTNVFERYKEFPQYQQLNKGMSLHEFKFIYFWEYLHRIIGRLLGVIFIIPFAYFWKRGYFNKPMLKRMFLLMGLGAMQGAMGWIMVKSGLVDIPYVSHYRLAMHLSLAFILLGTCLWFALDIKYPTYKSDHPERNLSAKPWLIAVSVLFVIQLVYGAFTAGLNAGFMYNTFPKMAGHWYPPSYNMLDPFLLNLVENPGLVQWIHRLNGTLLLIATVVFGWKVLTNHPTKMLKTYTLFLLSVIVLQYLIGIFTLLLSVPVSLGVLHQAVAIFFMAACIMIWHYTERSAYTNI